MCEVMVVLIFVGVVFVNVSCDGLEVNRVPVELSTQQQRCFGCPTQQDSFTSCHLPRCNCNIASIRLQNSDQEETEVEPSEPPSTPSLLPHPSRPSSISHAPSHPLSPAHLNPRPNSFLLPPPREHCKTHDRIALKWNVNKNKKTYYYLRYRVHPGPAHQFMETNPTRCGFEILPDLNPDTIYRVELRSLLVTENRTQTRRSSPAYIRTRRPDSTPGSVARFYLEKWYLVDRQYIAQVKWVKGVDNSCTYNMVVLGHDGDFKEDDILNPLNDDSYNITDLSFGNQYSIAITAFNEINLLEGPKTWLNLTVPTCFETYQQSIRCIPDKPENLTVEESLVNSTNDRKNPRYDVHLSWKKPKYPPGFYAANLRLFDDNATNYFLNITWEKSNATFHKIKLTTEYQVLLVAYSERGASEAAVVHRHIDESFWKLVDEQPLTSMELLLTIIGPLLVLCLAAIFVLNHYVGKRARNRERNKYFKEIEGKLPSAIITASTISVPYLKPDKWDIDIQRLLIKDVLGQGAFGIVRRGWYSKENGSDIEVAIKMLRDPPTNEELKQFCQEIEIMKSVPPHPHLVSLVGCVVKEAPLLVVEYCSKGDLQSYLRSAYEKISKAAMMNIDSENNSTSVYAFNKLYDMCQEDTEDIPQHKDVLSFARQVALGMEYLASLKMIHRDLATRNVLVCDRNTIKISDFGLSRDVYYNNVYCKLGGGKLPIRWMALESLTHQVYTTQSDVWSYGVLLWEMVTLGSTPYPGVPTHELLGMLNSGYRMPQPDNCSDELYALMRSCWKEDPKSRPSFSSLRETLDGLLEGYSEYLKLNNSVENAADIRYDNLNT
ncbi:unnamed protein product [Phaedon cochleariae]|uniref:receptor protein-tyrosine kinase n=1 Tax=Phaedon cochleariae TaxID=80249 RepID=A0A9N9X089_PHACE|nr:unnamed protein product [Phaedon cochleariae]